MSDPGDREPRTRDVVVSVVMPSYNARPMIDEALPAVWGAWSGGGGLEVIVVDDGSGDGSAEYAKSVGARVLCMEGNRGPSRARNAGAREARGEVLFFVDADVRLHAGAISRAAAFLDDHPDVAAVFGSYDDAPAAKGLVTEYKNLLHHFVHQTGRREASTFWSGCGAIRTSAFRAMGGFDERGYPRCIEDIELGYRLRAAGHSIVLDRGLQGTHLKRWTFCDWIRTDVFCRAIPWVDLNLRRRVAPDDLNISRSQKWSVALTGAALAAAVAAPFVPPAAIGAVLAVLAIVVLNRRWFGFLRRERGAGFALRCVPLHLLYFLYSGISYAYATAAFRLGRRARDGNRPVS